MTIEQLYVASDSNIDEVLQRVPSKSLLSKLLKKFIDDPSKESLDKAIENTDPVEAFRAVHTLKGVSLSLGLNILSSPCKLLTEDLRDGTFSDGWEDNYKVLCTKYEQLVSNINELED